MRGEILALVAAIMLQSAACTAPPASTQGSASLAGTGWQLVQFQSSDDAIGIIKPADPSRYQLLLLPNGELSMRLDCNRASGTWSYSPGADNSGGFTLSAGAMTRAMCPPGSMDTRIARDAAFVRGYVLKGNRLSLSLMADGGIYTWERIPE